MTQGSTVNTPPQTARKSVIYTRDGRRIDVSMRSDEETSLIERVQGHSTLPPPSASHPSVAKYSFSESGAPLITPSSTAITPRSVGMTPRTPRQGTTPRGSIDSQALSKALHGATARGWDQAASSSHANMAALPVTSGLSSQACRSNSPGRSARPSSAAGGSGRTSPEHLAQPVAAAVSKQLPANEHSGPQLLNGSQSVAWRDAGKRKTHINYSKFLPKANASAPTPRGDASMPTGSSPRRAGSSSSRGPTATWRSPHPTAHIIPGRTQRPG
jgi:hypothetical protein